MAARNSIGSASGCSTLPDAPVPEHESCGRAGFGGFTSAVIRLADLLESTRLSRLVEHGYDYELPHLHPDSGDRVVFARSSVVALEAPLLFNIDVPNARWTLALAPHQGWRTLGALLADSVLVLLSSLLIAGLTYALARQPELLRRQVELRTQELAHIVHELT